MLPGDAVRTPREISAGVKPPITLAAPRIEKYRYRGEILEREPYLRGRIRHVEPEERCSHGDAGQPRARVMD